jgi:hypothetical protein|nr:MAG TPA: hypothetical protein [Caudoviricetes sp.]
MKNKDKYNLSHIHVVERPGKTRLDYCFKYVEIEYGGKIVKEYRCLDVEVSKKFFEWLEEDDGKECKPTILTEKEKAYLSAVIKPFRKRIKYIRKIDHSSVNNDQFICIVLAGDRCGLPNFKTGTMYKGMEVDKDYTLEELGL